MQREISLPGGNKVGLKDLAIMSRQFATMVTPALSLLRSLSILARPDRDLRPWPGAPRDEVRTEPLRRLRRLSASPGQAPARSFPAIMVNMIRAGETGGFPRDKVLLQIAENSSRGPLRG
jgi:type IV pilus assembly protein PilC